MNVEQEIGAGADAGVALPAAVRIVLIDDNVLAARALERWFAGVEAVRYRGWAADAGAAVALVALERPDVVLLDLEMPGTDTMGLIPRLAEACPGVRVAMLSGHVRAADIERSLDAGAMGYIAKDEPTAMIADLVLRLAAGECVLSPLAQRALMG